MSQPRQEGEFHRADPAYKRLVWVWFAFTVVVGAIALFLLERWLAGLRTGMAVDQGVRLETWLHRILAGVCLLLAVAATGFGLWLRRIADATRRDRRWPPVAMRTSQDVRIRYLTSADALVSQFRMGAFALFALAVGLAVWAAWLLSIGG
jgi:hypothetical protein